MSGGGRTTVLKLAHEARKTPGTTRPNPGIIGDPAWGNPLCRVCDGYFHPDQDMVRVRRFGWSRAFVHGHHSIGEVARGFRLTPQGRKSARFRARRM